MKKRLEARVCLRRQPDIGTARWSLESGSGPGGNKSQRSFWSRIAASKMARVIVKMSLDRQSRSASAARRNVSCGQKIGLPFRCGFASEQSRRTTACRSASRSCACSTRARSRAPTCLPVRRRSGAVPQRAPFASSRQCEVRFGSILLQKSKIDRR